MAPDRPLDTARRRLDAGSVTSMRRPRRRGRIVHESLPGHFGGLRRRSRGARGGPRALRRGRSPRSPSPARTPAIAPFGRVEPRRSPRSPASRRSPGVARSSRSAAGAALFTLACRRSWRLEHFAMNGPGSGRLFTTAAERLAQERGAPPGRPAPLERCSRSSSEAREHRAGSGRLPLHRVHEVGHDPPAEQGRAAGEHRRGAPRGNAANFVSTIVGTRALTRRSSSSARRLESAQVRAFRRRYPSSPCRAPRRSGARRR